MESTSNSSLAVLNLDQNLNIVSYSQEIFNYCTFDSKKASFEKLEFKFPSNNIREHIDKSVRLNKSYKGRFEWQDKLYSVQTSPIKITKNNHDGITIQLEEIKACDAARNSCKFSIDSSQFVESSYDGYWDWYLQEDYEYMSPRFWEMFGYKPEEKEHKPSAWMDMIFPEDLEIAKKNLDKHIKTKGKYPYLQEVRYEHKNGSVVTVLCRGKVVSWDNKGNALRMVGTHTDITETKKHIEALNEFIHIVSHDLKEPARSISLVTSMIMQENPGVQGLLKKDLYKIEKSSKHMIEMLDELKEYTYISNDQAKLKEVDTNKILLNLIDVFNDQIERNNITVTIVRQLPTVPYLKIRMQQIFSNLLSNAIKYSKPEGGEVKINFNELDTEYIFSVCDKGIGIEPKLHSKVFRIFSRISKNKLNDGSSGFGLYIVKKIVEQYGGRIWFESAPNKGTTFFFSVKKST
ncbi:MAG: PAS domain-containing sensor histidine kinase [Rickettsiales bacterium]